MGLNIISNLQQVNLQNTFSSTRFKQFYIVVVLFTSRIRITFYRLILSDCIAEIEKFKVISLYARPPLLPTLTKFLKYAYIIPAQNLKLKFIKGFILHFWE